MIFDMSNKSDSKQAMAMLSSAMENDSMIEIKIKRGTRTLRQNNSLWLMFTQLSDELNSSGMSMMKTLKNDAEIMWTPELVKQFIWQPFQKAVVQTESTTELTTKQIDEVFMHVQKYLGENLGMEIRFPSIESLLIEQRGY